MDNRVDGQPRRNDAQDRARSWGAGGSSALSPPIAAREWYEIALRAGGAGTWRWDLRSGLLELDAAMEDLYGVQPGSFEGTFQAIARRIHPEDRAQHSAAVERALRSRERDYTSRHRILLPDGTTRWIRSTARVIRDVDGAPTELIGVSLLADEGHQLETERASAVSAALHADRALGAALRRLGLLGRLGDLLDQPLRLNVALRQVADLVVEVLADWCVIDLIEDAQARRGVVAHRDPALAGVAAATRQRAPAPRAAADRPVPEPLFVPDLSQHELEDAVPDPEHRQLLQALRHPGSYLLLPLLVNGRRLGTMTLVTADGWELCAEDVQLAADVANRCAAVIDTARLTAELARAKEVLADLQATSPFPADRTSRLTNEGQRIAAVHRYDVLDTPPDGTFDRITALAARVLRVPFAIVSIVDTDRIWFKSHHGLDVDQVERGPGLCASAILHNEPWVVTDAALDPRTLANPLVAGEFGLRFYAGIPLTTHDGHNLGTLCVLDREPRAVTDEELATLTDLAALVMDEMEVRRAVREHV